jgi:hypothetical protein
VERSTKVFAEISCARHRLFFWKEVNELGDLKGTQVGISIPISGIV